MEKEIKDNYVNTDNQYIENENIVNGVFDKNDFYTYNLNQLHRNVKNGKNKNKERSNVQMEENKILEKYMDKVDQDRRDQEERLSKNMQHMEQRITEERRLSEERLNKKYEDLLKIIETSNNNTNDKLEKLQSNFNEQIKEIKSDIKENTKEVRNISITTIVAIAAMVIAIIWAIYQQLHIPVK